MKITIKQKKKIRYFILYLLLIYYKYHFTKENITVRFKLFPKVFYKVTFLYGMLGFWGTLWDFHFAIFTQIIIIIIWILTFNNLYFIFVIYKRISLKKLLLLFTLLIVKSKLKVNNKYCKAIDFYSLNCFFSYSMIISLHKHLFVSYIRTTLNKLIFL